LLCAARAILALAIPVASCFSITRPLITILCADILKPINARVKRKSMWFSNLVVFFIDTANINC